MDVRPGYKQTEVGVIPEDWTTSTLVALADGQKERFDDGDWVEAEFLTDSGIRLLQTGNIGSGIFVDKESKKYISEDSYQLLRCKEVREGDILICRLAEPAGRACIVPQLEDEKIITAVDVSIFRPSEELVDRRYLLQFFGTRFWFTAVNERCGGSTRTRISRGALGKIPVPLPQTKAEQESIADALGDADALIESLEQLLAKKRQIKQGAMQELLTGKSRLPGFSDIWETKHFDGVLVRLNGKPHQIQASEYQKTGQYPVVDQGKDYVVGFSDRHDKRFQCPEGGVVVFGDHTCIVKFIDFDFLIGADGTQLLQSKSGQCTRFHALQLQYRGIEPTGYNRHFKFLQEREFLVPPLPEQAAIAAILSDMDAEIASLEGKLAKARSIKQGMMQELLTGRIRLV